MESCLKWRNNFENFINWLTRSRSKAPERWEIYITTRLKILEIPMERKWLKFIRFSPRAIDDVIRLIKEKHFDEASRRARCVSVITFTLSFTTCRRLSRCSFRLATLPPRVTNDRLTATLSRGGLCSSSSVPRRSEWASSPHTVMTSFSVSRSIDRYLQWNTNRQGRTDTTRMEKRLISINLHS